MQGLGVFCVLSVASVAAAAGGGAGATWPWPWQKQTTTTTWHPQTTTTPPTALRSFEQGVAAALGFDDVTACTEGMSLAFADLKQGWADYKHGGIIKKAEALVKFAEGIHEVVNGLGGKCAVVGSHGKKFLAFVKALRDPRFYTVHNALTLSLNLAEDRGELVAFANAWRQHDFFLAGEVMTTTILELVEDAGISGSNGTAAVQIAAGLAEGFATKFDISCFHDVRVEVSALAGGVLDVYSGVMVLPGLESLAHGLMGLAPALKDCLAERPQIEQLLKELADIRHPSELAKKWEQNIKDHGLDIAFETASAVLAYKGSEWHHFGKMIGEILEKLMVVRPPATVVV